MAARTSDKQPYQPRPIHFLFEYNKAWQRMVETEANLRDIEVTEVAKMLACGKPALGGKALHCENETASTPKTFGLPALAAPALDVAKNRQTTG